MKISPGYSKAVSFMRTRVKNPLNYFWGGRVGGSGDQRIPEASSCRYLGIILRRDLSWADQFNYTVQKAWKTLHSIMHDFKKGNSYTKSLAYMSLVVRFLNMGLRAGTRTRKVR